MLKVEILACRLCFSEGLRRLGGEDLQLKSGSGVSAKSALRNPKHAFFITGVTTQLMHRFRLFRLPPAATTVA